jgi:hypothetical protein
MGRKGKNSRKRSGKHKTHKAQKTKKAQLANNENEIVFPKMFIVNPDGQKYDASSLPKSDNTITVSSLNEAYKIMMCSGDKTIINKLKLDYFLDDSYENALKIIYDNGAFEEADDNDNRVEFLYLISKVHPEYGIEISDMDIASSKKCIDAACAVENLCKDTLIRSAYKRILRNILDYFFASKDKMYLQVLLDVQASPSIDIMYKTYIDKLFNHTNKIAMLLIKTYLDEMRDSDKD